MANRTGGGLILVTGAAGKTGRAIIRRLLERDLAVKAFVHRPAQRSAVQELGVNQVVVGDLGDRETVGVAMSGADAVYHICPNVHPGELAIGRAVVSAAHRARLPRIVFHSVLHPQIEAMPHHWAKLRVEELLFESGLEFTILQPTAYMQNVLGQWRSITEQGIYEVPYALGTRVAMVDLEDVAEAAARVLAGPGHAGATYELCGPELLDQTEIAEALGRALRRPVRARAMPLEDWREGAAAAGMSRYATETLSVMFRYYERFGMAGSPRVLEWLLARPPTSFSAFARRLADSAARSRPTGSVP